MKNPTKGFTFVELLVTIAILLALGGALISMLGSSTDLWQTGEESRTVIEKSDVVLAMFREDVEGCTFPGRNADERYYYRQGHRG